MSDLPSILRDRLVAMSGVVARRMFGAEAYFVGPSMFAFFTTKSIVLRLPHSAYADAVTSGMARPFLSLGAAQLNGWAELALEGRTAEMLEPVLVAAHMSGTHAARGASRRKRPARARRVKRAAGQPA
jgi:TfoX/Sxy family transcriptional regulator of competence genes